MQVDSRKQQILNSLAKNVKKLRGDKSQFIFCSENEISCSIISMLERGLKDPQITTVFKLAEAFNMKASELIKLVEDDLPEDFHMIDR